MIDCQVAAQPVGWFLTFPSNPQIGLVFFTDSEKIEFITSCQIDLADIDDPLLADLEQIQQCREYWYDRACYFADPF